MAGRYDSIVDRVETAYAHLARRHGNDLVTRWYADAAVWDLDSLVRQMSTVTTEGQRARSDEAMQPVIGAFQGGDTTAGVVLLKALIPGLLRIAALAPRQLDGASLDDHLSVATVVLAEIDPKMPRLYARILGRVRSRTRRELRLHWHRVLVTDQIPDSAVATSSIDESVFARLRLSEVAAKVRAAAGSGCITAEDWRFLVAHRMARWPGAELGHTAADRSRARRIGERLRCVVEDCQPAELSQGQ
jgi:hypothetical protein